MTLNKQFIVGHKYKLRPDYPIKPDEYNVIALEGRKTWWIVDKQPFFDKKPRKVIQIVCAEVDSWMVIFEGIENGEWHYFPEDFIEVGNLKHFLGQGD